MVVIGLARGGTSAVAGVLREIGLPMGSNLGANHEDPEFLSKDINHILEVIARRNGTFRKWGWKMPHSSEYILRIADKIRNPHVIVPYRNILSVSISHMKHSEAAFETAFGYANARQSHLSEVVSKLRCPTMLVNYEELLHDPQKHIRRIAQFVDTELTESSLATAADFINPAGGYRRVSYEQWTYEAVIPKKIGTIRKIPIDCKSTMKNMEYQDGKLVKTGDRPFVQFTREDKKGNTTSFEAEFFVSFKRVSRETDVSIVMDFGNGFSWNLREDVSTFLGENLIKISGTGIRGLRLFPAFEGAVSNVLRFDVFG